MSAYENYIKQLKKEVNNSDRMRYDSVLYNVVVAVLLRDLNRIIYLYSKFPASNHLSSAKNAIEDLEKNTNNYCNITKQKFHSYCPFDYTVECVAKWIQIIKINNYSIAGNHESNEKDGLIAYSQCNTVKEIVETYNL